MDDAARAAAVFRVMLGEEVWTVKEDGRPGSTVSFASKRDAVAEARRRARQRPAASVVVYFADRSVQSQTLFTGEDGKGRSPGRTATRAGRTATASRRRARPRAR